MPDAPGVDKVPENPRNFGRKSPEFLGFFRKNFSKTS